MDWIRYQSRRHAIVFCLMTIIVLCICVFYILSLLQTTTAKSIVEHSLKSIFSAEQFCFTPGNDVFRRDHIRAVVVDKFDNRTVYVNASEALKEPFIAENYSTLSEFIVNCRKAFLSRRFKPESYSIPTIFHRPPYRDIVRPSCDGQWLEFGVFQGTSLSAIAAWKSLYCGDASQPVYGFDTFQGLPTDWRSGYSRGKFRIPDGTVVQVPKNTVLVKGLFIDTLPVHLRRIDEQYKCHTPVSFVHIDCDIYDGARDVLFLLGNRFVSGTIIVFDELFNYPGFEKHEIKALYEFLSGSNLRLIPLGSSSDIDLNPTKDIGVQTYGFVVAPGHN